MANYYNEKILAKFTAALNEAKKAVKAGTITDVVISKDNSKMGAVSSVSTLPFLTCPARCKGTCGADCYAAKIANLYPNVLQSYAQNTALALYRPLKFWADVENAVKGVRFFRFHVSGDIINKEYFANIVDIATANKHCEILLFTKRFEIVNAYIKAFGDLPENLHVLFSGWNNLKPVNPFKLPETNVFGKEGPEESWKVCGGNCFECGCRGVGCWQAKNGDTIAFQKH